MEEDHARRGITPLGKAVFLINLIRGALKVHPKGVCPTSTVDDRMLLFFKALIGL